jgi:hypothetical protein
MRAADEPRKSKLNSYFTVKAGRRSHKAASGFAVRWRDLKGEGACDGWIFARFAASVDWPRLGVYVGLTTVTGLFLAFAFARRKPT